MSEPVRDILAALAAGDDIQSPADGLALHLIVEPDGYYTYEWISPEVFDMPGIGASILGAILETRARVREGRRAARRMR